MIAVHNLSSYNNLHCRCRICRRAKTDYQRDYMRRRRLAAGRVELEPLLCLLHGEVVCSCIDSQPRQKDLGRPFEAALWGCVNGHGEMGSRQGRTCLRCEEFMTMISRAIVTPP